MPKITKNLAQYVGEAIAKDYLITIAITSYTQAKYQTANLPFGLGKTTLAMQLAYLLNGGSVNDNYSDRRVWEKVHNIMCYDPLAVAKLLEPGSERKRCIIWDDPQATAPSSSSVPIAIRKLANFISTERPECACIFLTTPNLNFIAAPLRKLVNFEIIISERGFYEVHKISYYKDFKRPLQDQMHFDYVDEVSHDAPFPALPTIEQAWYNHWRTERKQQLYPAMAKELENYTKLGNFVKEDGELVSEQLEGKWIKTGRDTVFKLNDPQLAEQLHNKHMTLTQIQ